MKSEVRTMRAYKDVEEFQDYCCVFFDVVEYRKKKSSRYMVGAFVGYDLKRNTVTISGHKYSLKKLFKEYEYYDRILRKWIPFGVKE